MKHKYKKAKNSRFILTKKTNAPTPLLTKEELKKIAIGSVLKAIGMRVSNWCMDNLKDIDLFS